MKMNLPRYSLDNPKVIWFFLAVLFIGGLVAFGHLGKKEDAPFVIKSASIVTRYPGATPEEVEQLITEPIEREIQSMRRVYKITSESFYGMSKIMIELLPSTPADEMPQMWDELRRKILTVQAVLPEGLRRSRSGTITATCSVSTTVCRPIRVSRTRRCATGRSGSRPSWCRSTACRK